MNRKQLNDYIKEMYDVEPDFPWDSDPDYAVYRHLNRKWFALIMPITKDKLGLNSKEPIDIVNVKCDEDVVSALVGEEGFYRAYHMSKTKWISIALDGSASDEKIKLLLDMSYNLTATKAPKRVNY